jgi:hypothetical protein
MDADGTTGEATCMSAAAEPAAVASAKTGMATTTASVSAATAVTSAMLRPQGQSQQNGERRNGRQTPHTALIIGLFGTSANNLYPRPSL